MSELTRLEKNVTPGQMIITDKILIAILDVAYNISCRTICVDRSLPIEQVIAIYNYTNKLNNIVVKYYNNECFETINVNELSKSIEELEEAMEML